MTVDPGAVGRPAEGKWTWAAAVLMAAFFLAACLYVASRRLFWYDEIFTVLHSRLPTISGMWQALLGSADQSPFPYFLIVRAAESIFGRSEIAARVPSALALALGLLVTFACAKRLTDGLHGLIAQALLTCSFLPFYGYEARPYALVFLFSSLLMWCWLRTGETGKVRALTFGVVALAGAMIHFFFFFCLVPYAVCELLRWRWPSLKLIAGVAGAGLGLAMLSPQVLASRRVVNHAAWSLHPSPANLREVFEKFFPYGLFLLALIVILTAVLNSRGNRTVPPMPEGERLGWFFLLIPVAGYVLAVLVTRSFLERYFIGALPGIAVAFASLLHRQFYKDRLIPAAVLVLFAAIGMTQMASKARNPELIKYYGDQQLETRELIRWEGTLVTEGKLYTAVPRGRLVWLEAWYYSKHPERYFAISEPGTVCWALNRVSTKIQCWSPDDLKQHALDTAVLAGDRGNVQELKTTGYKVVLRASDPLEIYYLE